METDYVEQMTPVIQEHLKLYLPKKFNLCFYQAQDGFTQAYQTFYVKIPSFLNSFDPKIKSPQRKEQQKKLTNYIALYTEALITVYDYNFTNPPLVQKFLDIMSSILFQKAQINPTKAKLIAINFYQALMHGYHQTLVLKDNPGFQNMLLTRNFMERQNDPLTAPQTPAEEYRNLLKTVYQLLNMIYLYGSKYILYPKNYQKVYQNTPTIPVINQALPFMQRLLLVGSNNNQVQLTVMLQIFMMLTPLIAEINQHANGKLAGIESYWEELDPVRYQLLNIKRIHKADLEEPNEEQMLEKQLETRQLEFSDSRIQQFLEDFAQALAQMLASDNTSTSFGTQQLSPHPLYQKSDLPDIQDILSTYNNSGYLKEGVDFDAVNAFSQQAEQDLLQQNTVDPDFDSGKQDLQAVTPDEAQDVPTNANGRHIITSEGGDLKHLEKNLEKMFQQCQRETFKTADTIFKQKKMQANVDQQKQQKIDQQYQVKNTQITEVVTDIKGMQFKYQLREVENFNNSKLPVSVRMRAEIVNKALIKALNDRKPQYHHNRTRGRLETSHLYRLRLHQKNIFYKKQQDQNVNTDAFILIDNSGSMDELVSGQKTKMDFARETAAMIEEAVRGVIPLRIETYTDQTDGCLADELIKDFDDQEDFNYSWARIGDGQSLTPTAPAMQMAIRTLLKRPAKRHLLFVLTDGLPNSSFTNSGTDEEAVQDASKYALKQGIELFGIGIGSTAEKTQLHNVFEEMFLKHYTLKAANQLPHYLVTQFYKLLK